VHAMRYAHIVLVAGCVCLLDRFFEI
jgi:hypothetical protein